MRNQMKKPIYCVIVVVLLVACAFFLRQLFVKLDAEAEQAAIAGAQDGSNPSDAPRTGREYDTPVESDHPALEWFRQTYENRDPFLGFAGDLNDDDLDDLVILFHEDGISDVCWMIAALQSEDSGWSATEPARAPVENQRIRMFDMDKEPPMEFVITGEKAGQVGYAIYRLIDGELIDLFGDGMDDCC